MSACAQLAVNVLQHEYDERTWLAIEYFVPTYGTEVTALPKVPFYEMMEMWLFLRIRSAIVNWTPLGMSVAY